MKNKLLCYARLLRMKMDDAGCMFIKQNATTGNNLVMEFHRNNIDNNAIENVMKSVHFQYRLESGKDIIKILLFLE